MAVVTSKMTASAVASLINAVVFMVGYSSYIGNITGGYGTEVSSAIGTAIGDLGLSLGVTEYLLIGLHLFMTLLITLAIALILGSLAKDIKAAQSAIMPIMLVVMLPFIVNMFADISTLPMPAQILFYLIPYTHTFTATNLLMLGDYNTFLLGAGYQFVLLVIMLIIATKFFSSDKLFTMTFNFGQKSKRGRARKLAK